MTKLRKIAELGEEVLLKKAEPVENVKDADVQELIDEMIVTLKHDNGVGIAAPQVLNLRELSQFILIQIQDIPMRPNLDQKR